MKIWQKYDEMRPNIRLGLIAIIMVTSGFWLALRSAESSSQTGDRVSTSASRMTRVPAKVRRYVDIVMRRYDRDGDGRLIQEEWQQMSGQPSAIDVNEDSVITLDEMLSHVHRYGLARMPVHLMSPSEEGINGSAVTLQSPMSAGDVTANPIEAERNSRSEGSPSAPPATRYFVRPSRAPSNLPGWFSSRDRNGDGQLTLSEFSPNTSSRSREFERLDSNGDGIITSREAVTPGKGGGPASPE